MTTSYFLTAVSHHGSSDCLLYERYPIRRYLCRSTETARSSGRFYHLQMETPDPRLHPSWNHFVYDASASLLKRNGAVLNSWQKFRTAPFFYSLYALEGLAIIR